MINICVPTLKRYDTLWEMLRTIEAGTIKPDFYYILDNGGQIRDQKVKAPPDVIPRRNCYVMYPPENLGVAASWNWFLANVPAIRIVCNDDLTFFEDTIETLVAGLDDDHVCYPAGNPSTNSFSCYVLPDKIRDAIGGFDEEISPGYAYYEDNDYHLRMLKVGYDLKGIPDSRLGHVGSATLKAYTPEEMEAHHRKFFRAKINYVRKWGGEPGHELYDTPYNA
jgi:GT2 family glycosyltransferase